MKNQGFAVTTMVYLSIALMALIMFTVLGIVKSEYGNQRDFIEDVNRDLNICVLGGGC